MSTAMTRQQAQYLASFNSDYEARPRRGLTMPRNWVVWSIAADHIVEFDRLPPVDHYGEVLRNHRVGE